MSSRAYGAVSRHSGQVDLTLGCMRQDHQVSCLIPHTHLPGTVYRHTSLHKFQIIKRHPRLRRNLIHARVLRRTLSTLLPHRKAAEVAVELPAKRQKHRRRSSLCLSLVVLFHFIWLFS